MYGQALSKMNMSTFASTTSNMPSSRMLHGAQKPALVSYRCRTIPTALFGPQATTLPQAHATRLVGIQCMPTELSNSGSGVEDNLQYHLDPSIPEKLLEEWPTLAHLGEKAEAAEASQESATLTPALVSKPAAIQVAGFGPVPPPAEPELTLVTRLHASPGSDKQAFWNNFAFKCRLAWDVFFPQQESVMSPAGAVKSRLQMILVSDRCGLNLATLMQIKQNSMAALASEHGWESVTELEVQVATIKPNGDRVQLTLPLSSIPSKRALRDPSDYDYEGLDDDDEADDPDRDDLAVTKALESSGQYGSLMEMHGDVAAKQLGAAAGRD